ncbi:nucleolin-like [Drosophila miranda]|uniref:nucleolin-like n=1 Tax=Drosophila miranda TaxID=7229 RepID=UPI00143F9344|nr:nucleolin-like [Drosophila miranda]
MNGPEKEEAPQEPARSEPDPTEGQHVTEDGKETSIMVEEVQKVEQDQQPLRRNVSMATGTRDDPFPSRRKHKKKEEELKGKADESVPLAKRTYPNADEDDEENEDDEDENANEVLVKEDVYERRRSEKELPNSRRNSLVRTSQKSNVTMADSTSTEDMEPTPKRMTSDSFYQWQRASSISMPVMESCAEGFFMCSS